MSIFLRDHESRKKAAPAKGKETYLVQTTVHSSSAKELVKWWKKEKEINYQNNKKGVKQDVKQKRKVHYL